MYRKLLLPLFATAVLAGCVSDYAYRNGNGDYYYGQPQVEYRYLGADGYYGGVGLGLGYGYGGFGYGASYYYAPFGGLFYGVPGGYYGSPYYGGNGWYRPRPRPYPGHGGRDDHDRDNNNNAHDRPPPWRDLGGLQPHDQNENDNGDGYRNRNDRQRPMRRPPPESYPDASMRPQRPVESGPMMRERGESPSRMGGSNGDGRRMQGKPSAPPED